MNVAILTIATMPISAHADEQFRSPQPGDKGTYYLMDMKPDVPSDGFLRTTHRRVGPGGAYTGYTITDVNCINHKYRVRGHTEGRIPKIGVGGESGYTKVVHGSSKADLVFYSCQRFGEKVQ